MIKISFVGPVWKRCACGHMLSTSFLSRRAGLRPLREPAAPDHGASPRRHTHLRVEMRTYLQFWHTLHSGHCQPARFNGVTATSRHIP